MDNDQLMWPLQSAINSENLVDELGYVGMTQEEALEAAAEDIAKMFTGLGSSARVTRLRAELSRDALVNDLVLGASNNQELKWPLLQASHAIGTPDESLCPCGLQEGVVLTGSTGTSGNGGPSAAPAASGCRVGGDPMRGLELGALIFLALMVGGRRRKVSETSHGVSANENKGDSR
jgi:hypothetical protein